MANSPEVKKVKIVLFTNFSDEDFSWTWDGAAYNFEAHKSVYLKDWEAEHFAKHLVDRELNKAGKLTNDGTRASLLAKCIAATPTVEPQTENQAEVAKLNLNMPTPEPVAPAQIEGENTPNTRQAVDEGQGEVKPFCDSCDSKGVRHKKVCPKYAPINPPRSQAEPAA